MHDHDRREPFFMVGQRPRLQPAIEPGLATRKPVNIVRRGERLWSLKRQQASVRRLIGFFLPGRRATQQLDHFGHGDSRS